MWEVVQQLTDLIVEQGFKGKTSPDNTVFKGHSTFIDQRFANLLESFRFVVWLQGGQVLFGWLSQVAIDFLSSLLELSLEPITSPLQCVLDLVGEILQCTDGNRLFRRITSGTIVLGQMRNHNLSVSLGSKSSTLQHGKTVKDTSLIDVQSCLNIIQSSTNTGKFVIKVVSKQVLGISGNLFLVRSNVHVTVHGLDCVGSSGGLEVINIRIAEQELTRQVGLFNAVHIGNMDMSIGTTSDSHQSPVLEHLATNGSSANDEIIEIQNLGLQVLSEACNL
mmetsp:Transcript_15632/g.38521  ORF Transcript_15632/g.38521 Transcript_15632/m.38521 type:complete len:278 (-) Transcript_15632:1406-2239(-)